MSDDASVIPRLPTPYYQDDAVTIYHGDCREVTAWLQADVLITDPPYGTASVGWDVSYGRGQKRRGEHADEASPGNIANDDDSTVRDEALALWGRRPACVFGSPRRPDPPGEWADRLVWDKKRPGMNGGPWRYRHESIYVTEGFVRVNDAAVSIIEAWPDQSIHIHAKPHTLMLRLVGAAPPGVIADPFMGSGSTLLAARDLGRRAVGVELSERYCEAAARRLDQGVLAL
jgi:hypothetical protein